MKKSQVLFADISVPRIEQNLTLPAKFMRMLKSFSLSEKVKDKKVGIKMHFGNELGYTTIPPLFVILLVNELKECGAAHIKIMDNNPETGIARGYTREVLGCEVVSTFGATRKYLKEVPINFHILDHAFFGGEACDVDYFIDFSHVKGHGACGFGAAIKNIAMGVVPGITRQKLHNLEGGISYDRKKCILCKKCLPGCQNDAISIPNDEKGVEIFFHNCTFCQHCILSCPTNALTMENRQFDKFSRGMAMVTAAFLKQLPPDSALFINVLLNITIFCDCWGLSTAALVPDIGILASHDISAVEKATLDLIKTEDLIQKGLPKGRKLGEGTHLFEKIHGKNPYLMVEYLQELMDSPKDYEIKEIN